MLDIGCGDFRVSGDIIKGLGGDINWIAIDVSKLIIERNKSLYGCKNVNFIHMDATKQELSKADLVLVREVMQHLSNADILKLIKNIPRDAKIIATNTVPINCEKQNGDIVTGAQSRAYLQQGIFLNLPPFNIKLHDLGEWEHKNMTSKFICQELFPDNLK